jgi:acyl-CoA reductase-like NAD-dependent aldehyde dehydrogenase
MGGKAPLVVLDDADLDQAVDAPTFGAFMNQGQICIRPFRRGCAARTSNAR